MFQHCLIPVINKQTRITRRNATAIDHMITNSYLSFNLKTGIINTVVSDIFLVSETPDISAYPLTVQQWQINKTIQYSFERSKLGYFTSNKMPN